MDSELARDTVQYWEFAGILLGVAITAILSATETALASLSATRAKLMVDAGKTWMDLWISKPGLVITSILMGKSLSAVLSAGLMVDVTRRLQTADEFASWGLWAAIGSAAFLLLTFGEVLPKAVGKRYFEDVASTSVRYLRVPFYIFYPIHWAYAHLTTFVLKLFGQSRATPGPITFDEIEYMLQQSNEGETVDERGRLLQSVVEFPETTVREVMVPRTELVAIGNDMTFDDLIQCLVKCGHSRLPIYEESLDDIVGVFYAKDILRFWSENGTLEGFSPQDFLRAPYLVPETKLIADLVNEFQRDRIHMAIVIDEFGGTAGIITLEDIIEEIFGDIQDEYDTETTQIREMGDNRVIADARVPIYEIESYYDIELPDNPHYESLGGFILWHSGSVPVAGYAFDLMDLRFTVVEADPKKVISIAIEPVDENDAHYAEAVG